MQVRRKAGFIVLSLITVLFLAACGGGGDSAAPPSVPPTVQTFAADGLSINGATIHGTANPNGLATTAGFEWGTDNTFTDPSKTHTTSGSIGSGTAIVQVNEPLTSLTAGTIYYYRVTANNSAGTQKGALGTFTTLALAPTVTTLPATSVGSSAATLNANVNPNGLATTARFEWGTSSTLTTPTLTSVQALGAGSTVVSINAAISSLSASTTYYYRVTATNSSGTSQGTILNFTTPSNPPPVADAGPDQTIFMGHTVTLDGSGSTDAFGTIQSYEWTQVSGTPVTLSSSTSQTPTFTAPTVLYPSEVLQFELTVTDERPQSATAIVKITVKWGFFDDFSTDTTGSYVTFQTLGGSSGTATFTRDSLAGRVLTGSDQGIIFSKFVPQSYTGVFSVYFSPTSQFGSGGDISIRLLDQSDTYYEFSTRDQVLRKVRVGVIVDSTPFTTTYSQSGTHLIKITYSPLITTVEAFGATVSINTNENSQFVSYFEIESNQQNAYYDDIQLEAIP